METEGIKAAARLSNSALDAYDEMVFFSKSFASSKAPAPWVAFSIGGLFSIIGVILFIRRLRALEACHPAPLVGSTLIRAMIMVAVDSTEPVYTIVSYSAASFLFLGGLQLDYQATFCTMILVYIITSAGDTVHVLLAFYGTTSLKELVVTTDSLRSQLRGVSTDLRPTNLYEDLARGWLVILMVFMTQVLLVSFVVVDMFWTKTHTCLDGTPKCPVLGTTGSWCLYVMGIFMACVYLVGPKSNFGQSEQNPCYWLQLLLAAKQTGAKYSWYDPVKDKTTVQYLTPDDWTIWARFFLSYIVNGVGFHILVHALPIQIAGQPNLLGVVLRAVGMMHLADLDDTPGYTLKLIEHELDTDGSDDEGETFESIDENNLVPSSNKTDSTTTNDASTTTTATATTTGHSLMQSLSIALNGKVNTKAD